MADLGKGKTRSVEKQCRDGRRCEGSGKNSNASPGGAKPVTRRSTSGPNCHCFAHGLAKQGLVSTVDGGVSRESDVCLSFVMKDIRQ